MTRTVKELNCTYIVKGEKGKVYKATVVANTEAEATAILSKNHGKKGCAVIIDYTESKKVYYLADSKFFALATVVDDGTAEATENDAADGTAEESNG